MFAMKCLPRKVHREMFTVFFYDHSIVTISLIAEQWSQRNEHEEMVTKEYSKIENQSRMVKEESSGSNNNEN